MDVRTANAEFRMDPDSGVLREITLMDFRKPLLSGSSGLFDIALPLPDEMPHRVKASMEQVVSQVEQKADRTILHFKSLRSERGEFAISAKLHLRPAEDQGIKIRLEIVNHTSHRIPQILFPYLQGIAPTDKPEHELLHLGRATKQPYVWMKSPDDAAQFYDLYRRWYFAYGMGDWPMKWFRIGNHHHGLSVFSDDLTAKVQGLYVERDKKHPQLSISWAHYPHIEEGETWVSPEFTIQPHHGDWRAGIEPYKSYANQHLPTAPLPDHLTDSLGARSLYFSTYLYDNSPNFRFRDLPVVARDAKSHGLSEVICWFMFENYFELPLKLNPKLGTAAELKAAVEACREMGVNIVAFLSCRSLKTQTAPAHWFELDDRGNMRTQAWSYSLNFVPPFNPLYCNRDQSAFACTGSADYQKALLAAADQLRNWGIYSVSFDQLFAERLCYNPAHQHRPDNLIEPLYYIAKQIQNRSRQTDPNATFSGEFFNDVSQTFQNYNWDWISGTGSLDDLEPFRITFPKFRLGMLVDRSRRWLLEGFTRGLFLNFMPDSAEGLINTDHEFSQLAKRLAADRKTYARFFEDGQYLGTQHVAHGPELVSVYVNGDERMMIVANPTADTIEVPHETFKLVGYAASIPTVNGELVHAHDYRIFTWRQGAAEHAIA